MADQNAAPETQDQTNLQQVLAEREAQLAAANGRLQALEETIQALKPPPPGPPATHQPNGRPIIPLHLRNQIAAQGLTEQELEANGALIVPFINAYLGQAAGEVLAMIQQQADEITMLKMLRDGQKYPYAEDVMLEMVRIRDAEQKQGRYLDPDTAYKVALANNYETVAGRGGGEGGQFTAARQQSPAASPVTTRSRDMSTASSFRNLKAPVTTPEKPIRSGDDLTQMSREERKAFFAEHSNTPIKATA